MAFIVILTALTLLMIVIGSILVHNLRLFFKENYYQHSNSIILSIIFETLSITSIMAWYLIKIFKRDDLIYYSQHSIENDSWIYPLIHLGLVLLGQYFPIAAQLGILRLAIVGNWNELL
jgi:hypothetical protein